jgi:hypothetical protein
MEFMHIRRAGSLALGLFVAATSLLPLANLTPAADAYFDPSVTVNPACGTFDDNVVQFTDDNGNPSAFTYANGSQYCVRVDWDIPPLPRDASCGVTFYVPNGNATADLPIGLTDTEGRKTIVHVQEAGVQGPVFIVDKPSGVDNPITHINIGDNNGESYPSQIGWGDFSGSVSLECGH